MAELDMINTKVSQSAYQDQSEMDEALYDIFKRASDGHLTVVPCSIGAYSSATGVDLISISTDGVELPKIYMLGKHTRNHSLFTLDILTRIRRGPICTTEQQTAITSDGYRRH